VRIGKAELQERRIDLRRILATAKQAAMGKDAPVFQIKGPAVLKVRFRKTTKAGGTVALPHSFIGDEKFRLADLYVDNDLPNKSYIVGAAFAPADLELAKEISGVTLPLQDAIEHFDGLETWFSELLAAPEDFVTERGAMTPRPSVPHERNADAPSRGSW
jgi:hypothetical protein